MLRYTNKFIIMKKIYYFVIVALFCLAAASCTKEPTDVKGPSIEDLLIGKWVSDEDNDFDMYIELRLNDNGDGKSKCEDPDTPGDFTTLKIEWEYEQGRKDDILCITEYWDEDGDEWTEEWELIIDSISEDELVLIWEDDDDYEFTFERK